MQQHPENGAGHAHGRAEDAAPDPEQGPARAPEVFGRAEAGEGAVGQGPGTVAGRAAQDRGPDVFLDVPQLEVDEIDLDVQDLRARVSLQAEVLDLLKLNVGADVALGSVSLGISGVEARAQLKVRLDNVALIIDRVLTTLDRNPQILQDLVRGVGSAVDQVGLGAGSAVRDVGAGAGSAVGAVGGGAGEALADVGEGLGEAVEDVGEEAGAVVGEAGGTAARAVTGAGDAARETGRVAARGAGRAAEEPGAGRAARGATRRAGARQPAGRSGHGAGTGRAVTRRRRTRDDESDVARSAGRRAARRREEPP